jgi:uncharacterized protein
MEVLRAGASRKLIIGMLHMAPLPGTPFHEQGSLGRIVERAVESARALEAGGADGCLAQTVDRVYPAADEADPIRVAAMALVVQAVVAATSDRFQVGVQIMRNANKASLAVAKVAGGRFVRIGALVGATMSNQGLLQSDAHGVMAYRRAIGAEDVACVADIDSMHFRWFGEHKPTAEVARAARQAGASAVALGRPDEASTLDTIDAVRRAVPDLPVLLAGYTNHANAGRLLAAADGAFVGTCLERGGWGGAIDLDKVRSYVDVVRAVEG